MSEVDISLGVFERIVEADDFAPPCDSTAHGDVGSGAAAWALRWPSSIKPCGCPRVANPALMCDGCKDYTIFLTAAEMVTCRSCLVRYAHVGPMFVEALS